MNIWVDADACPTVIKDILFKASERTKIPLTLIANHSMHIPKRAWINFIQVGHGFDVADDELVLRCQPNDLVITSDIPLAAELIAKQALVLTPRGERYTPSNIAGRLTMRDFMETMRASGEHTGGPPPLGPKDRKAFADELDKIIAQAK